MISDGASDATRVNEDGDDGGRERERRIEGAVGRDDESIDPSRNLTESDKKIGNPDCR